MANLNSIIELKKELRPCYVDGVKAMFHGWFDDTRVLLKFNSMVRESETKRAMKYYEERGLIPPYAEPQLLKTTLALVEFEDGRVDKVEPKLLKFADSEGQFRDICWNEKGEENEHG